MSYLTSVRTTKPTFTHEEKHSKQFSYNNPKSYALILDSNLNMSWSLVVC